jgi:uncharacterized protein (TIGR04255 family)
LRVAQPSGLSIDALGAIEEMVATEYPNREDEYLYSGRVYVEEAGDLPRTDAIHQRSGFRFTSQDKRYVFFARLDTFALSVRAPYDRWESFRGEARRLWDLYRSVVRPEGVTRVAVRYINQLNVHPLPSNPDIVRMENFVRVYPEFPPDWPGGSTMRSFFMQAQFWQEDLSCWLVVNEAPVWPSTQDPVLFQLDFDFFREEIENPWPADDDAEVWRYLEQLHIRKNEVFEASITDETRRLIG